MKKAKHSVVAVEWRQHLPKNFSRLQKCCFFCRRPGCTVTPAWWCLHPECLVLLFASARAEQRDVKSYFTAKTENIFFWKWNKKCAQRSAHYHTRLSALPDSCQKVCLGGFTDKSASQFSSFVKTDVTRWQDSRMIHVNSLFLWMWRLLMCLCENEISPGSCGRLVVNCVFDGLVTHSDLFSS